MPFQPPKSLLARLCGCCSGKKSREDDAADSTKPSDNKTHSVSRNSERSIQSEEEELAAIEAEVDDDLEVLSNQSGEIRERVSSRRERQSSGADKPRGFGSYVKLGFGKTVQPPTPDDEINTPASTTGTAGYVAAPYTPGTPASPTTPRSDAGSAYFSNSGDERESDSATNQPLPGYLVSSGSSMVMYGRPPAKPSDNHIV